MPKIFIDPSLIGTNCIAKDQYYGTYRGVIKGVHKCYSDIPRLNVLIQECISPPSQIAISNKNIGFNREAYHPGSIHHFAITNIESLVEVTA